MKIDIATHRTQLSSPISLYFTTHRCFALVSSDCSFVLWQRKERCIWWCLYCVNLKWVVKPGCLMLFFFENVWDADCTMIVQKMHCCYSIYIQETWLVKCKKWISFCLILWRIYFCTWLYWTVVGQVWLFAVMNWNAFSEVCLSNL